MPRLLCITLLTALVAAAAPAASDEGRLSGLAFGDYYAVLQADDADPNLPQKRNAFQLRRIYFTYDRTLSETFDVRFRLEANDAGFGARTRMVPYVKHAYLRWKGALGGDLYLGESGTPTWDLAEQVWGYRAVEKTVLDLHGIGAAADIGLALKGRTAGAAYHLMVANGSGPRSEGDHGKKVYGAVQLQPTPGTHLEAYADLDLLPGGDSITLKGFCGRSGDGLQGGVETFYRVDRRAAVSDPGADATRVGLSAFGALPLWPDWRGFARLDVVGDDDRDATDLLVIGGLDWAAAPEVHILPNLYVQLPDGLDPNLQVRATALFTF